MIDLTIAICTVSERANTFLPKIVEKLHLQAMLFDNVEILYLGDNRKRKTGTKRNDLANLAQGKYIVYVDDDDDVSGNYVSYLLNATKQNADCICFQAKYYENNKFKGIVNYSAEYKKDTNRKGIYERIPNHITAIKTSLVRDIGFKDINIGEDFDFAKRLKPHIKTQSVINAILYHYYYNTKTTLTK